MIYKHFFYLLLLSTCIACKQNTIDITQIKGQQLPITDSIKPKPELETFITPYRAHINNDLDSALAYAVNTYSKKNGHLNTAIGNFMADVVYTQTNPIFKTRTGKQIDMVLLNHGGIRSIISQGTITARTAYNIMPFENSTVVVALKGTQINKLINYLEQAKRAHPISKLKLVVDKNFKTKTVLINNKPIDNNKVYYVATSDYLFNGGDSMTFFATNDTVYNLDYKIRNCLIDYFKKTDTINPVIDDRFIQIE